MCYFKAIDHLTTNGKHILIYEYLQFPITIMLANDIVVGINPEGDEISLLTIDKHGVYDQIASMETTKPTLGNVVANLSTHNLSTIETFNKGKYHGKKPVANNTFSRLILGYYKR